ncbi:hypothetical protein AC579_2949 [Pseudocercospora musae]|uniref:Uncharacterized protein n=1 Tax=Pseudocercospora musae TaxID=113226 RepID=A0A139IF91_9PEZI|nr:hypothetical protein AC579_2949 [Pseudocercospora musae]
MKSPDFLCIFLPSGVILQSMASGTNQNIMSAQAKDPIEDAALQSMASGTNQNIMSAQAKDPIEDAASPASGAISPTAQNAKKRVTFFDLPAELRNQIYDGVAEHDAPKQALKAYFPHRGPPRTLADVCKQTRREYLPRLHQDLALWLFDSYVKSDSTMEWLDIFGRSRVPLTRKFCIWCDPFCCKIVLHGKNSEKQLTVRYDWFADESEDYEAEDAAAEEFVRSHVQHCESDPYLALEGLEKVSGHVRSRMAQRKAEQWSGLEKR